MMMMKKKIFLVRSFPICQAGLTAHCVCHKNFETPISMRISLTSEFRKLFLQYF